MKIEVSPVVFLSDDSFLKALSIFMSVVAIYKYETILQFSMTIHRSKYIFLKLKNNFLPF